MARSTPFRQELVKPEKIGPEASSWFWNPNMPSIKHAPAWFVEPLKHEMGEELEVTWNPIIERWLVWSRSPRLVHPICQGWRLLFVHNDKHGNYMPLDERLKARLWSCSRDQHGSGKAYFARIESEFHRDEERKNRRLTQEAIDQAMPYFDHSKIKVGYGKSSGSKFSTYHA